MDREHVPDDDFRVGAWVGAIGSEVQPRGTQSEFRCIVRKEILTWR